MKLTDEMIKRAREVAEDLCYDYAKIGIRVQEVPFELGCMDHVSHIWIDGDDTGEELDGVCAQDINAIGTFANGCYFGDHVAVIAGNTYTYGQDEGEVIIEDAEVVEILA